MSHGVIPTHPQPSAYETTIAVVGEDRLVTHTEIDQILAQPPWSVEKAREQADAAIAARKAEKPKKTTAKKRPAAPVKRAGAKPKASS